MTLASARARRHTDPTRGPMKHVLLVLCVLSLMATASAQQDPGAWIQPYPQSDLGYRELIVFETNPNLPARLRGDRVKAFGRFNSEVEIGSVMALVVGFNILLGGPNLEAEKYVVADLAELRFVGADASGVTFEARQSDDFKQPFSRCVDERLVESIHRPAARFEAVYGCAGSAVWSAPRQLRFPLTGSVPIGRDRLLLSFAYKAAEQKLSVTAP